ncbi:hypothetical protein VZ95_04030 [Elstera litoralis]|uniref:DUF3108 domain-containing protein n=1 Tax=Elstera litoralis TaxID=552518 RepID=A0A0F3IV17_9PROT|nr:DUF3108 domain-containing protein [Elstera litoralis]KJV10560.1 hypothetical protein VZ95_04030 [Elstera litoralis]
MRPLCSFFIVVSLGLPVAARAAEPQGAELEYRVYVGGIAAARYFLRYTATDTRTEIALTAQTEGFTDWLLGWRSSQFAEAEVDPLSPSRARQVAFRTEGVFRGEVRRVELRSYADRPAEWQISPPEDPEPRTPILPEQTAGTFDPLTGTFLNLRKGTDVAGCPAEIPFFDGRRRFDAVFGQQRLDEVKPSSYTIFSGPTLVCQFTIKRIGGYVLRANDLNRPEDRDKPIFLHLGTVLPGLPRLPVRIESELTLGSVIAHLVAARPASGVTRMAALPAQ